MTIVERLDALRKLMKEQNMQAYVVPTRMILTGSEGVGDFFKTRKFLSGFTGSAGTLVVTPDWAGVLRLMAGVPAGFETAGGQYDRADEDGGAGCADDF